MKSKANPYEPVEVKNGKWEQNFRREWSEVTAWLKKHFPDEIEKVNLVCEKR